MFPARFSLSTLNLWKTNRWPDRAPALKKFVCTFKPDILCLQEMKPELLKFLEGVLTTHTFVQSDFQGWISESNIFWRRDLFEKLEHGYEDIGILESNRKLFWVRLRIQPRAYTILVSTVHFTYQEHPDELQTGRSPRIVQTRNTVSVLQQLKRDNEPVFLAGDFNDSVNPLLILHDAGFDNCFTALGISSPTTFPSYPTGQFPTSSYVRFLDQARDWIVANHYTRPLSAQVPHCYEDDIAPSDHWPVLAVYELIEEDYCE